LWGRPACLMSAHTPRPPAWHPPTPFACHRTPAAITHSQLRGRTVRRAGPARQGQGCRLHAGVHDAGAPRRRRRRGGSATARRQARCRRRRLGAGVVIVGAQRRHGCGRVFRGVGGGQERRRQRHRRQRSLTRRRRGGRRRRRRQAADDDHRRRHRRVGVGRWQAAQPCHGATRRCVCRGTRSRGDRRAPAARGGGERAAHARWWWRRCAAGLWAQQARDADAHVSPLTRPRYSLSLSRAHAADRRGGGLAPVGGAGLQGARLLLLQAARD
jgi:hypothetical protein